MNPPFFEEIAARKIKRFPCLRLRFVYFHIFVDFRVPLADPLGQIGSIFDRSWYHLLSNVPTFSAARAELLQRSSKKLRTELAETLQRTSKKLRKKSKESSEN